MSGSSSSIQERRPNALAEIGLNSIYNLENTSSDEEPVYKKSLEENDAQSIVGVSLGPQQQRLNSVRTPAREKVSAIRDGDGFFDLPEENEAEEAVHRLPDYYIDGVPHYIKDSSKEPDLVAWHDNAIYPSLFPFPGTVERNAKGQWQQKATIGKKKPWKHIYYKVDNGSGDEIFLQKELWADVLAGVKPAERLDRNNWASREQRQRSVVTLAPHRQWTPAATDRSDERATQIGPLPFEAGASPQMQPKPIAVDRLAPSRSATSLRRSTSDESLQVRSTISRVSTLGDDSRFDHIKEQVNSRTKAIKDSLEDSNIRFPSFPSFPSFSSLSLANLRKEHMSFTFRRASSASRSSLPSTTSRTRTPSPGNSLTPSPEQTMRNAHAAGRPLQGGPTSKIAASHPHFTKACAEMTGDLVVLGGYRGSVLRSAEAPHRQLWVPVKVGLNIRKVDMEVGFNVPEDDMKMESKIYPDCMLSHIGPVDISRRLFKRLRACDGVKSGRLRVHDYGYDWRLDPEYLSDRLIKFLEGLQCNKKGTSGKERGATVIAHSLGGLITRNAVNKRPDLFAGVVYAGTPSTCVNILGPLRNGDDVLLSSRVLTAQVNFSIRTSFALLPLDGKCFFNKETGEEFPVDFFDPQTWVEYRLSPCVARPLPPLVPPPTGMLEGWKSSLMSALPSVQSSPPTNRTADDTSQVPSSPHENGIGTSVNAKLEPSSMEHVPSSSVATAVTISRDQAMAYLTTMLARVKKFKQDTAFRPDHHKANAYPPAAVMFGKSTPTVCGAKVKDREHIKRSDAYDNLAFGSGDGVVLARAAMLPEGYEVVTGGVVSSERGHISLLGDLEGVGRALNAVRRAREQGVGLGLA